MRILECGMRNKDKKNDSKEWGFWIEETNDHCFYERPDKELLSTF
jgi:hypothetical protein